MTSDSDTTTQTEADGKNLEHTPADRRVRERERDRSDRQVRETDRSKRETHTYLQTKSTPSTLPNMSNKTRRTFSLVL